MNCHIFHERANGVRTSLSPEQAMAMSLSPKFYLSIDNPMLKVYKTRGIKPKPEKALKYGGRGRGTESHGAWRGA